MEIYAFTCIYIHIQICMCIDVYLYLYINVHIYSACLYVLLSLCIQPMSRKFPFPIVWHKHSFQSFTKDRQTTIGHKGTHRRTYAYTYKCTHSDGLMPTHAYSRTYKHARTHSLSRARAFIPSPQPFSSLPFSLSGPNPTPFSLSLFLPLSLLSTSRTRKHIQRHIDTCEKYAMLTLDIHRDTHSLARVNILYRTHSLLNSFTQEFMCENMRPVKHLQVCQRLLFGSVLLSLSLSLLFSLSLSHTSICTYITCTHAHIHTNAENSEIHIHMYKHMHQITEL